MNKIKKILAQKGLYSTLNNFAEKEDYTLSERKTIFDYLKSNIEGTVVFDKQFNISEETYQKLTKKAIIDSTKKDQETRYHLFSFRIISSHPIIFALNDKTDKASVLVNVQDLDFIFEEEDFL